MLGGAATPILNALGDLLSGIAAAITIAFLVIFMLIFGGRLITRRASPRPAPSAARSTRTCSHKIYQSIGGYLGGLALICTINATLTTSFLAINRVPFFLPLGIVGRAVQHDPLRRPDRRRHRHLADRAVHRRASATASRRRSTSSSTACSKATCWRR